MTPGLNRGLAKGARTILQVIAGGALTALVTALVGELPGATQGIVMGAWVAVVATVQNYLEGSGTIREFLPTPGLVAGPASDAVATVEAVADETGDITGAVTDTEGATVGEVVGQLGYVEPKGDEA